MLRILLIDDEPLIHQVIRTLSNWKENGFELCGEAYNGEMALDLIEKLSPDIAIIDVNMPEMNGVELHRTIRERFPSVKTIMLSSYDDYDYVRECLKNGAVDYLLKHRLDEATLLNVLNKAVIELQQEDRIQKGQLMTRKMEEKMKPVFIRDHITNLLRGKQDAARELEEYAKINDFYSDAVSYIAAALQIVPFLMLTEFYSDVQTNRLVQQAVDVMQQSLGDIFERTAAYVGSGRLVVIFAFKERSEHAAAGDAERWMGKLQHSLELLLNLKSSYALGYVCGSLAQLEASYHSAERALDATTESTGLNEHPEPTDQASVSRTNSQNQRVALTIEEQKQLLLSIESMDREAVQRLISSVFVSIRHQPIHSQTVHMIVSELLHTGDKALKKWMPMSSAETAMDELPSRSELGGIGSMGELELWLQTYYESLLQLLKLRRAGGPYSRHVSQAIQFILERYQGYITLEQVAGAIGLNPSYLSRIFKEETQSTFSEYINRVRIDAGRKLLESGQYSIKQISSQVGFTTYNYFFKVFKELTGMTPHAYLSSLRPESGNKTVKFVE